jgi:hypothetical protein
MRRQGFLMDLTDGSPMTFTISSLPENS